MRAPHRLLTSLFLGSCLAYGCLGSGDEREDSDEPSGVTQSLGLARPGVLEEPTVTIPHGALETSALGRGPLEDFNLSLLPARTYTGYALGACEDVAIPGNVGTWRAFYPFSFDSSFCAWTWTSAGGEMPNQLRLIFLEQQRQALADANSIFWEVEPGLQPEPSCNFPSCSPELTAIEVSAPAELDCSCAAPHGVPGGQPRGGCSVCAGSLAGVVRDQKAYLRVTDTMQRDALGRVTLLRRADGKVYEVGKVHAPAGSTLLEADVEDADMLEDGDVYVH